MKVLVCYDGCFRIRKTTEQAYYDLAITVCKPLDEVILGDKHVRNY